MDTLVQSLPEPTTIPPLREGERLTRTEFVRRYEAMPGIKAELIEGVVYMASPVNSDHHASPHLNVGWWLNSYRMFTPGLRGADNGTLQVDDDNEPQPDVMLWIATGTSGKARLEDGYVKGAPEFAVEVSATSVRLDTGPRRDLYERIGIQEYLVYRVLTNTIDWWQRVNNQYVALAPDADGIYRSRVFPGLWLDTPALFRDDLPALWRTLQAGLAMPEHAAFVQKLRTPSTGV